MTHDEFFEFSDELYACFPSVSKWLIDKGDLVLAKWESTLAPVELADAKQILNEWMVNGKFSFKFDSDKEDMPRLLRQEAMNRRQRAVVPAWKLAAIEPRSAAKDNVSKKFRDRMMSVARRYNHGEGDISLEQAQQMQRQIMKDYDAEMERISKPLFAGQ